MRLKAPFPPTTYIEHNPAMYNTIRSLHEWEVLGGRCSACGHIGWLNKDAVLERWGDQYLMNLRNRFRCDCGNRTDNVVLIGRLPR
ncbi:hypothetical protein ACU4I5_10430 [Ensifer adhaerens]